MRFRAAHKLVSYLLVAAAVGTLTGASAVPLATLVLLVAAGAASWFAEPEARVGQLVERAAPVLNLGALGFFAFCLYEVVRSFPEPDLSVVLNLVLFLVGFKLFHRRTNRDYLHLYVLSFLLVLAAAWLAQSVAFVAGFGAYVVLSTWTLILFHLRREIEDNYLIKHLPESATERVTAARVLNSRRVVGRPFFLATAAVSLVVFVGSTAVFLVVPRIGIGFLTGGIRRRMNLVGFSDQVTLGQHGLLSGDNDTVVLRAKVDRIGAISGEEPRDGAIAQLYWRGTVYDRYQVAGGEAQWKASGNFYTRTPLKERLIDVGDGRRLVWVVKASETPLRRIPPQADRQEIQVVGLTYPVAFALDSPIALQMPPAPMGAIITLKPVARFSGEVGFQLVRLPKLDVAGIQDFNGAQYTAWSVDTLRRAQAAALREAATPLRDEERRAYLQVPATLSRRVAELARTITEGRPGPSAKAQAVTEWLRANKSYTTDLKRDPSIPDPLEDFLFAQSAGHCEYFATAAAMLLRLADVPTRYVNGFHGGEWNGITGHITIRDNRAHSWVEAHLGPFGWMRVDATPAAQPAGRMSRVRQVFDSLELFWSRWVIEYNVAAQVDLARRLGKSLGLRRQAGPRGGPARPFDRRLGYALIAVGTLAAAIWTLRRRGWRLAGATAGRDGRAGPPVFRLYQRALDRLATVGWVRRPAETPHEFAARLEREKASGAAVVAQLTRHYTDARYGGRAVPHQVLDELGPAIEQLGRRSEAERPAAGL